MRTDQPRGWATGLGPQGLPGGKGGGQEGEGLSWQRYGQVGRCGGVRECGMVRTVGDFGGLLGRLVSGLSDTGLKRKSGQIEQHSGIQNLS